MLCKDGKWLPPMPSLPPHTCCFSHQVVYASSLSESELAVVTGYTINMAEMKLVHQRLAVSPESYGTLIGGMLLLKTSLHAKRSPNLKRSHMWAPWQTAPAGLPNNSQQQLLTTQDSRLEWAAAADIYLQLHERPQARIAQLSPLSPQMQIDDRQIDRQIERKKCRQIHI